MFDVHSKRRRSEIKSEKNTKKQATEPKKQQLGKPKMRKPFCARNHFTKKKHGNS